MTLLCHMSSAPPPWGGTITLHPVDQGAKGLGVFFSETEPRPAASEVSAGCILFIRVASPRGWRRTRAAKNRPRTWTAGRSIRLSGLSYLGTVYGVPAFTAGEWSFQKEELR